MTDDRSHPRTLLTLLLKSFRKDGGLRVIQDILTAFHDEVVSLSGSPGEPMSSEDAKRLLLAYQGIQMILDFYNPALSSKSVVEVSTVSKFAPFSHYEHRTFLPSVLISFFLPVTRKKLQMLMIFSLPVFTVPSNGK